jgi:hypothetical protein
MKRLDACLKLSLPRALAARVLDSLLEHPDWVGPFITYRVEGHGDPESIASPVEQVRGHAERMLIEILLDAGHVADLLQVLRADLPSRDVLWWVSPVSETGSLG